MNAPKQMTAETLNALKGWPSPHALDFPGRLDSAITERVPAGSVVHLNSAGNFAMGVGSNSVMPMFIFQDSDDPDVTNPAPDPSTQRGAFVPVSPTGVLMALVATGAYELTSTNFKTGQTYNPNTPLTAPTGNDPTSGDAGQLEPGTLYTDMIVGLVSRGVVDNGYGFSALAFWPHPVFPTP